MDTLWCIKNKNKKMNEIFIINFKNFVINNNNYSLIFFFEK